MVFDSEARLDFHREHSLAVAQLSCSIGERLNYNRRELSQLRVAAFLYDIGLMNLESELLKTISTYKPALCQELALKEIFQNISTQFDPQLVEVLLSFKGS